MSTQAVAAEPETHAPPPPLQWRHYLALVFFLVHAVAILESARPSRLLYPPAEAASGYHVLARLEKLLARNPSQQSTPLSLYCYALGVNQQWNTFAPVPPMTYRHHSITADYGQGRPDSTVWKDDLELERAGVGLHYDPTVKFVDNFRLPAFQERFLQFQAERLIRSGQPRPRSLSLWVEYVKMDLGEGGQVVKQPTKKLPLRTLWMSKP